MKYISSQSRGDYFPPILGNGEITAGIDCEGAFSYNRRDFSGIDTTFDGRLFRAGRRHYITHDRWIGGILSFGTLAFNRESELKEWSQELLCDEGMIKSVCVYQNNCELLSESFIHPSENIYALRKTAKAGDAKISYTYTFAQYDVGIMNVMTHCSVEKLENGAKISFCILGQDRYCGELRVFLDGDCDVEIDGYRVTLTKQLEVGEAVSLYVCLEDDLYGVNPSDELSRLCCIVEKEGFDGLLAKTNALSREFFNEGYVKTGDSELDKVYKVALHNLRCYTTRWSIPVGLNNALWDGKFFAFDEYYSFLGLLGSNRLSLAKRVPDFRLNVCLNKAIKRASEFGEPAARFVWETSEYGEELAIVGFWHDHVFHMALIAIGAFEYYEHSQDRVFLEQCYRMIRACAMFYTRFMLYHDSNGSVYVGKCTDLERLGEFIENPFMTSCGIIKTLEVLVRASDILGVDKEYRDECEKYALALRETLPHENGRYVPYKNSPHKSIAVFAGKFPYDVIKNDDELLAPSWEDFIASEALYGNMYRLGKKVSPWYACWKAEGYARIHDANKAYECALQAIESVGAFGEMFEINEPQKRFKPWFTTASGIYISTINEMLLQSDGENIFILPAMPDLGKPVSFKLSVKGGAVAEVDIADSTLKRLTVSLKNGVSQRSFNIYFKGEFLCKIDVSPDAVYTYNG